MYCWSKGVLSALQPAWHYAFTNGCGTDSPDHLSFQGGEGTFRIRTRKLGMTGQLPLILQFLWVFGLARSLTFWSQLRFNKTCLKD